MVATAFALAPVSASGQLATRVAEVEDGAVRFAYATRTGVEICDQGIRVGDRQMWWRTHDGYEGASNCRIGIAEVELDVRDGRVRDVEVVRNLDDRDDSALDLGEVSPEEAQDYLLSLPYRGATDDGAEEAIFPAMLADVDDAWPKLMSIAKDRSLDEGVRKNTLFWLGQAAADRATEGLAEVALDEAEDQEIRNSAIFALSQRPDDEAIPVLMEVARTGDQAETRRTAMFWLAQSEDERVVPFFEEILLRQVR